MCGGGYYHALAEPNNIYFSLRPNIALVATARQDCPLSKLRRRVRLTACNREGYVIIRA
jgi:hypothetical protein